MLRRVIAHLRRQDWTAVAIELVVVVAGVFIGVQASNWNADRETNQKAAIFTERLKADLRVEAWNYEAQIGYNEQVLVNAKRAADALTGKTPLADEALLIAAYRATQFNGNSRRRATYDELTSTGEIGLIRDQSLRALAMDVYTQPQIDQIDRHGQESEYRKAFRMAFSYQVQQALQDKCGDHVVVVGDYAGIAQSLDYPCTTGLDPATIAASAAVLRQDPRFTALLNLRITDIATDVSNLTVYFASYMRDPLRRLAKEKP
ncbi:MAG: hypothetical protein JSS28_04185 [Proteobacteria bacterium]|nr:hypothetical protein [Pseudomonadota bacterium]